jgi:hypothetical protein
LGEGAFLHAARQVVLVHQTGVAQDRTAGVRGLGTLLHPIERLFAVDLYECGVLVGVVGTDPLDVLPVARSALISHYDVVVRLAFLAFPLKADASWHVAVWVNPLTVKGPQM